MKDVLRDVFCTWVGKISVKFYGIKFCPVKSRESRPCSIIRIVIRMSTSYIPPFDPFPYLKADVTKIDDAFKEHFYFTRIYYNVTTFSLA